MGQSSLPIGTETHEGTMTPVHESARIPPNCCHNVRLPIEYEKDQTGWRYIVRNFTPAWFAVNMGTGITSILLFTLPYSGSATWIGSVGFVIFLVNMALFVQFLLISMLRYMMYPDLWMLTVTHPTESMTLGTFPMGLATIINMICLKFADDYGDLPVYVAWGLWVFDAIVSILTATVVPYTMMTRHKQSTLSKMTATWLLPIVACVVAAASGGVVANVLPSHRQAYWTIIVSYGLWAIGVMLALMVMTIYFQRLMLYKLPPREALVSVFLPIGPLGQGGFGIQKLGIVAKTTFPHIENLGKLAGEIFYDIGFFIALMMWAFGLVWLFFAVATVIRTRRFPFNLGWWALTFPLGVFANCTCQMGDELGSDFFWGVGVALSVCVFLNWLFVGFMTLKGVYNGSVFVSQCVVDRSRM